MRYIFTSYTGLTGIVSEGLLTRDMIETGLFFFGCAREHSLWEDPNEWNEAKAIRKWEHGSFNHRFVVHVIKTAEKDGRIEWRKQKDCYEDGAYDRLFNMLDRNGIDTRMARAFFADNVPPGERHWCEMRHLKEIFKRCDVMMIDGTGSVWNHPSLQKSFAQGTHEHA
jgi:hypothetical protein